MPKYGNLCNRYDKQDFFFRQKLLDNCMQLPEFDAALHRPAVRVLITTLISASSLCLGPAELQAKLAHIAAETHCSSQATGIPLCNAARRKEPKPEVKCEPRHALESYTPLQLRRLTMAGCTGWQCATLSLPAICAARIWQKARAKEDTSQRS